MQATLTWVDLTAGDRDRMRRVLDLFKERGTLDEMGLLSVRSALADVLFPGTSTILTRLRYAMFVPWMYRGLEQRKKRPADLEADARWHELYLIRFLEQNADNEGIIGVRARAAVSRLPSSAYWSALVQWGVFLEEKSQSWYHAHFDALAEGRGATGRADDPGVVWGRRPHWHPRLPEPPDGFPEGASFALTREEAEFLRGRFEERCAGSLLAWLAGNGGPAPADAPWDDAAALGAPEPVAGILELARRFSLHVEGMPLIYTLLLAEKRRDDGDEAVIEEYRGRLVEWAAREAGEVQPFDPDVLWAAVERQGGRAPTPQRRFIEAWSRRIAELAPSAVADDARLRELIAEREIRLKGARARMRNRNRLLDWRPGVGVGRADFRWRRVRQLLIDLHQGLAA